MHFPVNLYQQHYRKVIYWELGAAFMKDGGLQFVAISGIRQAQESFRNSNKHGLRISGMPRWLTDPQGHTEEVCSRVKSQPEPRLAFNKLEPIRT